jgi:hypothetical protein
VIGVAFSAARFLGRSRALSAFGGLVAVAGLIHELERRRERDSNEPEEE